jgi:hypothetical protein
MPWYKSDVISLNSGHSVSLVRQALAVHSRMRDSHVSQEFPRILSCYQTFLVSSLLNEKDDRKRISLWK